MLAGASTLILLPSSAIAVPLPEAETIDLEAFNAARAKSSTKSSLISTPNISKDRKIQHSLTESLDPSPFLSIRGGRNGQSTIQIPRVGYSLYKTSPELASRCVSLALRSGVRHFDVGTLYNSNSEIAKPIKLYLDNGLPGLQKGYYKDETPELLELLDATSATADKHAQNTIGGYKSKSISPTIDGSAGRGQRRDQLFISHKLSNAEQSTEVAKQKPNQTKVDKASYIAVKRSVKNTIAELGCGYLDMVSIHSPLTDKDRRLATYQALLDLRDSGFIKAVGVCNYGLGECNIVMIWVELSLITNTNLLTHLSSSAFLPLGPLKEIQEMVGDKVEDLPACNQLELSPFNMHKDVVSYCDANGIAVGCSAWSKLSGVQGPAEGWAILADLAKAKGMTKAQLLVRWSMQKGYVCVPRSGCSSKIERIAIAENSYGGVNGDESFVLTKEDMKILDGLDIGYKAGKLGRRDGWDDADVTGDDWDPTEFV